MSGTPWSDADKLELRCLWLTRKDGKYLSAREVGRRMGFSRGKVLGQVKRMNLVREDAVPKRARQPKPLPSGAGAPVQADYHQRQFKREEERISHADVLPIEASELRSRKGDPCCYPLGTPGKKSFRFCDEPTIPGKPYCAQHAAVVYTTVPARKPERAYG